MGTLTESIIPQRGGFIQKPKVIAKYEIDTVDTKHPYRTHEMNKAYVDVNGVRFNADEESIRRMSSIMSVAAAKLERIKCDIYTNVINGVYTVNSTEYLQAKVDGYNNIYKSIRPWKNYYNEWSQVQIETIGEALELALYNQADIWSKY